MTTVRVRLNSVRSCLLVLAATVAAGCGASEPVREAPPARDPMAIEITPDLQRRIKVGRPERRALASPIHVVGRVEADGTRLARISAPVTGRIVELHVIEGQAVRRGQVLATVYSTELAAAESAYLKALSEQAVATRAVDRAKQLLAAGVIGEAELQRREADLEQVRADVSAASEQLRVLGLDGASVEQLADSRVIKSLANVVSTIDGVVLDRAATVGQVVEAVEPVFEIADLSRVWLVADVPEQHAGALRVGQAITADIPALPGHQVEGQLTFVSAIVDRETRTIATRLELANPEGLYKPAMLATLTLRNVVGEHLVVPATAIVRDENASHVFVRQGDNRFRLRPVLLGADSDGLFAIVDGVSDDEEIVLDGAFHLNNERRALAVGAEGES